MIRSGLLLCLLFTLNLNGCRQTSSLSLSLSLSLSFSVICLLSIWVFVLFSFFQIFFFGNVSVENPFLPYSGRGVGGALGVEGGALPSPHKNSEVSVYLRAAAVRTIKGQLQDRSTSVCDRWVSGSAGGVVRTLVLTTDCGLESI